MKFSKIKITKDGDVELTRVDEHQHSKDAIETSGVNPLPSFVDAHQAPLALFLRVFPALKSEEENLRVSTISLGEKDGKRSVQVSATLSVESCGGAGASITTPRISEPGESPSDDLMYLSKGDLKMLALVEEEATRYANGETAQGEMFKTSENTKAVDDRMGAASVASTRKPRSQRPVAGSIPAVVQ